MTTTFEQFKAWFRQANAGKYPTKIDAMLACVSNHWDADADRACGQPQPLADGTLAIPAQSFAQALAGLAGRKPAFRAEFLALR